MREMPLRPHDIESALHSISYNSRSYNLSRKISGNSWRLGSM